MESGAGPVISVTTHKRAVRTVHESPKRVDDKRISHPNNLIGRLLRQGIGLFSAGVLTTLCLPGMGLAGRRGACG